MPRRGASCSIWERREAAIPETRLICAGEFFLDFIFFELARLPELGEEIKTDNFALSFGGGAAITALAAARLGTRTELLTVWGDTALDEQTRRQLEAAGVACGRSRQVAGERSGLAVAVSTRQDRYFLTCPGANRHVEAWLLEPAIWAESGAGSHVHLGLTPTEWPPWVELVSELQRLGATVSWDLGWDAAGRSSGFRDVAGRLDVLFLNEQEACRYTSTSSPDEALQALRRDRTTVVIKLGASGSMAAAGDEPAVSAPGVRVDAVDTVGAGDAFNGGFLSAWLAGRDLAACLLAGNVCGALSTRAAGGTAALPDEQEFERTLAAHASGVGGAS